MRDQQGWKLANGAFPAECALGTSILGKDAFTVRQEKHD
jgi:hypothetical protein